MKFTTKAQDAARWDGKAFAPAPILHTAEHAVAVYADAEGYGRVAMVAGFDAGTVLENGSAQVGIAWSKDLIVISPRGSDDPGDWLGNFVAWIKVPWHREQQAVDGHVIVNKAQSMIGTRGRIGLGFRRQVQKIAPDVLDFMRALVTQYPEATIVVTGHSLGAALVPLLVLYLDAHDIRVSYAVMHEAPRVGSPAFAAYYEARIASHMTPTWSIVNVSNGRSDIVTRMPMRRWGFRHVGRRVIITDKRVLFGDAAWQKHRAENPIKLAAAWRVFTRFYRSARASIRAHFGKTLLATLRAVAKTDKEDGELVAACCCCGTDVRIGRSFGCDHHGGRACGSCAWYSTDNKGDRK